MRILIYSYNYYPEPIGIAPLMTELAEGFTKRGHQVRVVTGMPWYPKSEIDPPYQRKLYLTEIRNGVNIQRSFVWARPERSFRNRALFELSFVILSLFQALKGWRPDVILLTVPGLPVAVPAAVLSQIYRTPVVLNLQDILPDAAVHVGLLTNPKLIQVFKALERFAYRIATKIAVIAEGFIDNLVKKGVPAEKIELIPNWVDVNFIRPLPQDNNWFREEHSLQDKFVVLYSGNIALTQGLETVIESATHLRHLPQICIVIVGEEKALSYLREYCEKVGADNVLLLPFQPRERLPEMLAAANVGLVVQKKNVVSFNMPSKIQVLLASGRPIIGSVPSEGTAAKAIQKSGGGMVVPPENPQALAKGIMTLYANPEEAQNLGRAGREYAIANYAFETTLERYETLFAKVVKR